MFLTLRLSALALFLAVSLPRSLILPLPAVSVKQCYQGFCVYLHQRYNESFILSFFSATHNQELKTTVLLPECLATLSGYRIVSFFLA